MKILFAALVVVLGSASCLGSLSQPTPARNVYAFAVERGASSIGSPLDVVLDVRAFGISPASGGGSFLYRLDDARYETDYYATFLSAPEALITDRVRSWLAAARAFAGVLPSGSRQLPTHVLEGNVAELYGDFRGSEPAAVVALDAFLLDARAPGQGVVWQARLEQRVALDARTPDALVAGWNAGLAELLAGLEAQLCAALETE